MGRRTSGARVGLEKIGNVQANASTLTTTQTNADLTLAPNGTGTVVVSTSVSMTGDFTIQNQKKLILREASANGTNYIGMQAAANMTGDYTIIWPSAVASSNGYILSSDTSGNLSWTSPSSLGIAVTDPGSTATVHYPIFGTNAGSIPSTLTPLAKSNLSFVPSTGELTATIGSFANVYGGTGSSGTITIRGTSNGTKATASVLMSDNVASSSTTTGTLVVTGGVGVSGTIYTGGLTTSGTISAGTVTETSSIALKENLNPITDALDTILNLQGWIYDRKDGSSKNEAGLIAEDVYEILPNLVQLDDNGKPMGVKYTKLTAYLIEAVKGLKKELDELRGK